MSNIQPQALTLENAIAAYEILHCKATKQSNKIAATAKKYNMLFTQTFEVQSAYNEILSIKEGTLKHSRRIEKHNLAIRNQNACLGYIKSHSQEQKWQETLPKQEKPMGDLELSSLQISVIFNETTNNLPSRLDKQKKDHDHFLKSELLKERCLLLSSQISTEKQLPQEGIYSLNNLMLLLSEQAKAASIVKIYCKTVEKYTFHVEKSKTKVDELIAKVQSKEPTLKNSIKKESLEKIRANLESHFKPIHLDRKIECKFTKVEIEERTAKKQRVEREPLKRNDAESQGYIFGVSPSEFELHKANTLLTTRSNYSVEIFTLMQEYNNKRKELERDLANYTDEQRSQLAQYPKLMMNFANSTPIIPLPIRAVPSTSSSTTHTNAAEILALMSEPTAKPQRPHNVVYFDKILEEKEGILPHLSKSMPLEFVTPAFVFWIKDNFNSKGTIDLGRFTNSDELKEQVKLVKSQLKEKYNALAYSVTLLNVKDFKGLLNVTEFDNSILVRGYYSDSYENILYKLIRRYTSNNSKHPKEKETKDAAEMLEHLLLNTDFKYLQHGFKTKVTLPPKLLTERSKLKFIELNRLDSEFKKHFVNWKKIEEVLEQPLVVIEVPNEV